MPHGSERGHEIAYVGTAAFAGTLFRQGAADRIELAQSGPEPIDVPRPGANQTITVTVVAGRPLKLAFPVDDVKGREIVRDDLVLDFDNGGKVVLKDYMHAFGQLGEQRTTIIQPDGKHYAFTELLAPSAGPGTERTRPGTDVVVVEKPPAGETQTFKLTTEKPMALNFTMSDVARSQVDKDGNLVLTFKDKAVLVLAGYSALKDSADIALYYAKGDKIALGDLAPGAGPGDAGAEGGHLFAPFDPGNLGQGLDHLGPLGPLQFGLVPPPGPPGVKPPDEPPPGGPPPGGPPPPDIPPPPELCKPNDREPPKHGKDDCAPPVCEPKVVLCEPKGDCNFDFKDHGDRGKDHGKITWVKGADCVVAGDAHWAGALWGKNGDGAVKHADTHARGWIDGHDGGAGHHGQHTAAQWQSLQDSGLVPTGDNSGWRHGHDDATASGTHTGQFAHLAGDHGHGGQETHSEALSHHAMFDGGPDSGARDQGSHAPAHAGDHGAGAHFAAAHDVGAVTAHAESHAPQVQNHAQHNVMGH